MRLLLIPKLLLVFAALAALVGAGEACGPYRLEAKLPGPIRASAVDGVRLVAVTGKGHLVSVDVLSMRVRDFGTLNTKLLPEVAAHNGKALVASEGRLHLVDLAN